MALKPRAARTLAALALAAGLLVPSFATSDDTVLFSTVVPPNVMVIVDNSGSMHGIVWHPAFDPMVTPTCTAWSNTTTYFVRTDAGDSDPTNDTDFRAGSYTVCGRTRTVFVDPLVQADSQWTRWDGRYLNWYFSPEADAHVAAITSTNNGTQSACLGGGTYSLYRRARVTAAQQILREVICQVNAAGSVRFGLAQYRRPIFPDPDTSRSDPNGGYVIVPINDYLDASGNPNVYTLEGATQSHGDHLDDAIDVLVGESQTPISETLFSVYTYFMSRTAADRPVGADGATVFPRYNYRPNATIDQGGPHSALGAPTVPDSPVQFNCQRNFVILITDGEPTHDDFDVLSPTNTAEGFADFPNLIGDFNPDGENETPGDFPGCTGCESTRWLDDIARFMQTVDFRPDLPAYAGREQVIDVYTVGFTTTPFANDILLKTAQQGNGKFYFSNDPEALAADLVDAVTDILQKSQSFTAATVPAVRTAEGGRFYTSVFVPSREDGYWTGHLESWEINNAGEILDAAGNCALSDPTPGQCLEGQFLDSAVPFWDAGQVLTAAGPAGRNLKTTRLTVPGVSSTIDFNTGTVTPADLGVTAADIASYDFTPYAAPADADGLKNMLVDNVRGCELGTTGGSCVKRPWLLGDIFHSSPVVVPGPQSFFNDPSYRQFEQTYATRQRVITAGANDGFLHIFDSGTWQPLPAPARYNNGTGAELAGFMPYTARQNAKRLPLESGGRTTYFVDGAPSVADVWFYQNPRQNSPKDGTDWQRWRTVLLGGMRQGGNQIYALDISNPGAASCLAPATGSGYPCYLWEFPREDAPASITDVMGQTWSEPIIAKVRVDPDGAYTVGYDRWVAIFAGGYHPTGDPNDFVNYDPNATAGRAIIMLDLATGEILGMKKFDGSATPSSPEEGDMEFAIASTPAVYDVDFDGYADVVFVGDLGGNLWKWVIRNIGDDPIHGAGNVSQPRWAFKKFFTAPSWTDGGGSTYYKSIFFPPSATLKNNTLWLAFGTGERNNLPFEGEPVELADNNRFYAMTDLDVYEVSGTSVPLGEGNLTDLTTASGSACSDVSAFRGFYLVGEDGEKFVTQSDIFFYFVFVASYTPQTSTDPCETGGLSKLYAFRVYCGEGLFDQDNDGVPESVISLGQGMPTDPKITISSGDGSGSGSPNPNRVIINKQDGELATEDAPPGFGAGIGQFYWRELSN